MLIELVQQIKPDFKMLFQPLKVKLNKMLLLVLVRNSQPIKIKKLWQTLQYIKST